MSSPTPPAEEEGHSDNEFADAWIRALQGQPPVAALSAAARAGALLRQLVLQAQGERLHADAAYTQALLDQWARMGLVGASPHNRRPAAGRLGAAWRWLRGQRAHGQRSLGGPATALGCLVLLGVWVTNQPPSLERQLPFEDAGVVRGSEAALQVGSENPDALALQIAKVLQRAAVPLRRVNLPNGAVQLQAKLPALVPATDQALRKELASLGVAVPEHGRLNLVISHLR